jgi:hypothetical protein
MPMSYIWGDEKSSSTIVMNARVLHYTYCKLGGGALYIMFENHVRS